MRIISILLILMAAGLLQGCFPVVAAGVGSGVMMSHDRRTSGAYVEDEAIENKAYERVIKQFPNDVHINITSYNRIVLLSGEAPSDAVKEQILKIVSSIENVRNVHSELLVSGVSSMSSRSNDSLITSRVKMNFVADKRFSADYVKVVTENGTVFMMGLVKHAEAEAAAEVASTSGGVHRVVKLFEYID